MSDSLAFNSETLLYNNLYELYYVDYNPLNLPPNTVRVRTNDGNVPYKTSWGATSYETATIVPGTSDVYDVYKSGTSFKQMLYWSTNVIEVLGANTTGITDMSYMFYNCNALTTVPLFDTSKVTDMKSMFDTCISLISVPLFDTSSVTDMSLMFWHCTSLTTVPLLDTSNVTSMYGMFEEDKSLTSVPLLDTSNVTDMHAMFWGCTKLTSVPLFDTSNATDMGGMFEECTSLTSVPLFNTSNVTNMTDMFYNCYKVQSGALALYQQASTQATPPSIHTSTFTDCGRDTVTGAAELAQIPASWK